VYHHHSRKIQKTREIPKSRGTNSTDSTKANKPWQVGNTTQRGYGGQHQALRKQVARLVAAGTAFCWRCGLAIQPWMS